MPAIYSWEKPSELLFIKEREGSLDKKGRKGSSLWECAGDFQAKQMRNLAFFTCIKSAVWGRRNLFFFFFLRKWWGRHGRPAWGTVAANTEHFHFLQANAKVTFPFYFCYLELRKISHWILDNILSQFLIPLGCHLGGKLGKDESLRNSLLWYRTSMDIMEFKSTRCFSGGVC